MWLNLVSCEKNLQRKRFSYNLEEQKSISALGLSSKCACFPFHSEQEMISLTICSWEVLQKHKMNSEDLVLCLQRQQRTVQTKMSAEEIRRRWLQKDENIFKDDLTKLKRFSICFVSRRTQHKNQQTLRNLHCFLKRLWHYFGENAHRQNVTQWIRQIISNSPLKNDIFLALRKCMFM